VINVTGYVTEDQTPTEYVPDAGTPDPAKLLREQAIKIRFLLDECDRLEAEIAQRDATIQELMIDLVQAQQLAAQPIPPTQT
jgi:hypothetical protein